MGRLLGVKQVVGWPQNKANVNLEVDPQIRHDIKWEVDPNVDPPTYV